MYLVVVGLLRHLLIAATQLSLLEGANKDAQNPSFTPLLLLETFGPATQAKPISDLPRFNYLNKSYQRWTGGHGWPH